ncbi:MAG: TrkH family potassium uptake protein, partial [Azoarcus sp.]|nr:TrkH family potassium uptake protein [Azoarcus sp.]
MRSYFPVIGALGLVLMLFGLVMAFPLTVSYFLSDGAVTAYDEALLVTFACGLLAWLTTRKQRRDLRVHDGFLLVAATWIVVPVFGAMPLMIYLPGLS